MEENQNNQQPTFKCSGDCYSCLKDPIKLRNQWHYCAAQKAYDSMQMLGNMQKSLSAMQGTIDELKDKIEAIQNNEVCVCDSTQPSNIPENVGRSIGSPITQQGSGVI